MKKKLGVLFGGQSSEYSVSLHSAGSFLKQLHSDKYDTSLIGIAQDGTFYLYEGDIDHIEHDNWKEGARVIAWIPGGFVTIDDGKKHPLDVVFPVLHGKNGEDGSMQGLLQVLDLPYVGCDVLSSAMCMDKEVMHQICQVEDIPAAEWISLHEGEKQPSFEEIKEKLPLPWVVKPCNAGSSYGVHFVETREQFEDAVKDAFFYDGRGKVLVEKAVEGFEIGCAVMGNNDVFAGNVDEIETNAPIFDFDGKYQMVGSAIYCPARIGQEKRDEARALAKKVYKALNCSGMARVDMFYQPDGTIILNEVNTIPGFTSSSRWPTMMKEAGVAFPDAIDRLIELALEKPVGRI